MNIKDYTYAVTSYKGRLNKKKFLIYWFLNCAIHLSIGGVMVVVTKDNVPLWAALLVALPFGYTAGALQVKRLHDHGKSGWYLFTHAYNSSHLLRLLMFQDGESDANQYDSPQ